MGKITISLLILAAALPAQAAVSASSDRAAPAAAQRGVDDPRAFVEQTYAAYARASDRPPADQSFVYSRRLRALFDAYDAWQRRHEDLVGSLAFDWWTNSQDWGEIRVTQLSETQDGPDHRTVTARFRNYDAETTTAFHFVREHGRWFLDDAVQGDGGSDGWTLSTLLRERPE